MATNLRKIINFLLFSGIFSGLALCAPLSSLALNIPLTVTDYADAPRINEPVTSGVPLPEDANITSIEQLGLFDSQENPIPAQFSVLSRWKGTPEETSKPIKWVLLDFQANIPKNGTTVYYLKNSGPGNTTNTNLIIQQENDKIYVATGKAKFQINKHYFNLFDYIWVDQDNDGSLNDLILSSSGQGGVVLTDDKGKKFYTILEPPEEIKIEEQGPLRAVIKIRGVFKAADGAYFAPSLHNPQDYPAFSQPYPHSFVYYNARIYFYNNKDYIKLFFTLENNGANGRSNPEQYYAPIQAVYFDSVNILLKPHNFLQPDVLSLGASTALAPEDSFSLYQDWKENLSDKYKNTLEPVFENGIYYALKKNSQLLSQGLSHPGWVDLNSNSRGIGLAIRNFWQNFPKKISLGSSEISIELWPQENYYPYCQSDFSDPTYTQPPYNYNYDIYCKKAGKDAETYLFDSGVHKTYELSLRFYSGNQAFNQSEYLSKSLENPLMALASPEWYAKTKALGMVAPSGLTSADPEINEAMQRFEKLLSAFVDENDSGNKLTIFNIKTKNPPHWETLAQNKFFGWMNFGDLLWSGQIPSSLHYDWTYSMLVNYLRSGKRKLFAAAVEMAKHRYDIDQYHGDKDAPGLGYTKYMQNYYESSGHADPTIHAYHPSQVSLPTHTWNGGLVLYYLLTGDKKAYEAAEEVGKGVLNYFGTGGINDAGTEECAYAETRYETWSLLNLINLYRAGGNPEYLKVAKNIAKNRLLYREEQVGAKGCLGVDKSGSTGNKYAFAPCKETGCNACGNFQPSVMLGYAVEPLIQIHYETQDEELKNLLIRIANFVKDKYLYGGDYDQSGKYRPLQSAAMWIDEDRDCSKRGCKGEPLRMTFFADLFAYIYKLTNNAEYLGWARKSFRDAIFYFSWDGNKYGDPKNRAILSYINGQFPETHTKTNGWLGRTNQVYLYTEWQLENQELQITSNLLPEGIIGQNYNYPLSALGGKAPYLWEISSGKLPDGLSLNSSSGIISGAPTVKGAFNFTAAITDSAAKTAAKTLSILIKPALLEDTTPPSAISSLAASNITQTSVALSWPAPGDDGNSGTASSYDIRYSSSVINAANWNSAIQVNSEPQPQAAGSAQSMIIAGLSANTAYYFAIKTLDESGNTSGLSNVVNIKTLDLIKPIPDFQISASAAPISGIAPLTVNFKVSAASNNGAVVKYEWDFEGKGNYGWACSITGNAGYVYNSAGNYPATLKITDQNGHQDTYVILIQVLENPDAPKIEVSLDKSDGMAPLTVSFKVNAASSTGIAKYEWDFEGNGVYGYKSRKSGNVVKTYTESGTYLATLKVTDFSALSATKEIAINVSSNPSSPKITLSPDLDSGKTAQAINLTVNNISGGELIRYEWDFKGDGIYDRSTYNLNTINCVFRQAGIFKPRVRVTDKNGLSSTASAQVIISLDSNLIKPRASFTLNRQEGEAPFKASFTQKSQGNILLSLWDFDGNGYGDLKTSGKNNVSYFYREAGYYLASLTVRDTSGLEDKSSQQIKVTSLKERPLILIEPQDSQLITGIATLAVLVDPRINPAQIKYQYQSQTENNWQDIGMAASLPYSLKWDTASLANGDYLVRAIAQESETFISEPVGITINNQTLDPDSQEEILKNGEYLKETKIDASSEEEIYLYDGTQVKIPAQAINNDDTLSITIVNPDRITDNLNNPEDNLSDIRTYREVSLENEGSLLGKEITLVMPYEDKDNDGLVDGTDVKEETLNIYTYDEKNDEWIPIFDCVVHPDENFVEGKTNHLSLFGLGGTKKSSQSIDGTNNSNNAKCFIATSCFGTATSKEIKVLSLFRDQYLLTRPWGRKFVRFYYRHAPAIANYIKDKEPLKAIIRCALRPLIELSKWAVKE